MNIAGGVTKKHMLFGLGFSLLLFASKASATELICHTDDLESSITERLRSISLALRGQPPSFDEYQTIAALPDPMLIVDTWLQGDDFAAQAVGWHNDILWNRVGNIRFTDGSDMRSDEGLFYRDEAAVTLRGDDVGCLDEPAVFVDGAIQTTEIDGAFREGYVDVSPYWAPEESYRVCAFDAQTTITSSRGIACGSRDGLSDPECGCGPNLRYCSTRGQNARIAAGIGADIDERVRSMVKNGDSYLKLFSSDVAYVDGALAHYLKNLLPFSSSASMEPASFPRQAIPEMNYDDQEAHPVSLDGFHAGILTSPAYLLRFQTNRSRASQFYEAFLCEPFQPPPGGLPSAENSCSLEPDLQKRCGCKYCHAILEPAGSHWGRWREYGAGYLHKDEYPQTREDCEACGRGNEGCSQDCRENYVVSASSPDQAPYIGKLKSYEFRREEHEAYVETGPRNLVTENIINGKLPSCVARRTSERLLGRALSDEEQDWLEELTTEFVQNDFDYRRLVRAIVTGEKYGRVR